MASNMGMAIRQLVQEKGISEELVMRTIEESLLAAYKRKYGTDENAVVRFSDDFSEVTIYAQKKIVEDLDDPVVEITLDEALEFNSECEIGDELLIEINPKDFDRIAIQSAKQKTKQKLREIQKDTLYSEFKDKVGEMIIGYYQRERHGNIYVDLGKVEGILPKKHQSPRETYHVNDRIKAMIYEVNKSPMGLQIVLSRTHVDFVQRIFELEVPEIYDKTVDIFKIVREPGYRTKIAVFSKRDDVDPVGACVGLKGVRIQAIVKELEGEKIDILKYDPDPRGFIKNALSPAAVSEVILLDESKKQALVVVDDSNFALAIGKQGLNVRLANKLVDWNIDVKNDKQFAEMDISIDTKKAVSALFSDVGEEITGIMELPGVPEHVVKILKAHNYDMIEDVISLTEEELHAIEELSDEDVALLMKIIDDNIEIVEEDGENEPEPEAEDEAEFDAEDAEIDEPVDMVEGGSEGTVEEMETETTLDEDQPGAEEVDDEEEGYECPECGALVKLEMTSCPGCGVGLSFEEVEEE